MTTRQTSKRLVGDLKVAMRDAEELVKATGGEVGERIGAVRNRLEEAVDATKTTYKELEDRTLATAKATDRCIREHPYQTIGVAFGLGLLIGALAGRKW